MELKKIILTLKIFTLLISLVIIYFILEVEFINAKLGYLELLEHNWKKGPIIDIIETENQTCPDNYQHMIDDYWPGTIEGCLCKTIFKGSCRSQISSSKMCTNIQSIDKYHYKLWKNKYLCALRLPTNYRDIYYKRETCQSGEKRCGILDSIGNVLCIPNEFSCPINYIKIISNQEYKKNVDKYKNITNLQVINYTQQEKLLFSNMNHNGKVLVEFRISQNTPCADPDYENNGNNDMYILDKFYKRNKCLSEISGKRLDERYEYLDTYSYSNLVEDNSLINLLKKLPFFPIETTLNHSVNLYMRNYIGYTIPCIDKLIQKNITMDQISSSVSYIETQFYKMKDYYWIWNLFILSTTLSFIVILVFSIVQKVKKVVEKFLFTIFPFSLFFLCIGSWNLRSFCLNIYNAYKIIIPDTSCGDGYTNDALESYMLYLYDISRIILSLICLKLVLIVLVMCLICQNQFKVRSNTPKFSSTLLNDKLVELR